ncbi:TPR repeat containing exported protein [Liberibacter crescens BT-1]|uniref:TPR repeat containing exported protein n=1 Tax=Liberibacter crescens (strain BT-1) TaxID=1215343 RepID=L0ES64_LIBCB|nr:tol-pal system protein YbgF [Liberibacter crescens]AGA64344.1 TPR repeat containing exported protein [Liberibacter crescens BT-1]
MKKFAFKSFSIIPFLIVAFLGLFNLSSFGMEGNYSAGDQFIKIQQLESDLRQLNGRIEEMSFQLLQMQESVRKTQQDNEFRFQEIEKKLQDSKKDKVKSTKSDIGESNPIKKQSSNYSDTKENPSKKVLSSLGTPPSNLGSLRFDNEGNPINYTVNKDSSDKEVVSENSEGDDKLYKDAYNYFSAGNYALSEQNFRKYISEYTESPNSSDATFYLGESLLAQKKYNEAAKIFLAGYKTYGNSKRAPEMLLKLGVSLVFLDEKKAACASFKAIDQKYPKASNSIKSKSLSEQKRLSC